MISLTIIVEAAADRVDDFIKYLTEEARDALDKEPGCRRFEISRSSEQPHVFALFEVYDDMAALEAHRQTAHYLLFQERVKEHGLIAGKTLVLGDLLEF
jgi:(4S)-4-hydroxy-5-phosphonooxypentane-2,3-dione isomerase